MIDKLTFFLEVLGKYTTDHESQSFYLLQFVLSIDESLCVACLYIDFNCSKDNLCFNQE